MQKLCLFLILLFSISKINANHLTGGEMSYRCLGPETNGNTRFEITLIIYRDNLSGGSTFDNPASVSIIDLSPGGIKRNINANLTNYAKVAANDLGPCARNVPAVDIERATYVFNVSLAPSARGYQITHQRCCRNDRIFNLNFPGDQGSTFTVFISPQAFSSCNSSPRFVQNPPLLICVNTEFKFDFSASDANGDSVVYNLCSPFIGGSPTNLAPTAASNPPYSEVRYKTGYSAAQPMGANAPFDLNPKTGLLKFTPDRIGIFTVGVCADEYKNGIYIGSTRRDLQFNVADCIIANADAGIKANQLEPGVFAACNNFTIQFENNSTGNNTNTWDFGVAGVLNDTSNQKSPIYTYADTGAYTVRLIINKGTNCSDTAEFTLRLYPNLKPAFDYQVECLNRPVLFFDRTTSDITTDFVVKRTWYFGDGTSATGINPTHTFTSAGNFNVKLVVETRLGCFDSITQVVNIPDRPVAKFKITGLNPDATHSVNCSDNRTVTFINESPPGSPSSWDFGVSGVSTDTSNVYSPQFTFPAFGNYTVRLIINKGTPCVDTAEVILSVLPEIKPDFSFSNPCVKAPALFNAILNNPIDPAQKYLWNFGDNSAGSSVANPSKNYSLPGTYNVSLTITSTAGCTGNIIKPIQIDSLPLADFSINGPIASNGSYVKCSSGLSLNFSQQSRRANTYFWDFGVPTLNNDTSISANPGFIYTTNGTYTITLIVNKGQICSDTITKNIRVVDGVTAAFSANAVCAGNSVSFSNTSSALLNDISSYSWDFGDGTGSAQATPAHVYSAPGTYQVSLVVRTSGGCVDTLIKPLIIHPIPKALFNVDQFCPGQTYILPNTSTISSGNISTYQWNISDGRSFSQSQPTVVFQQDGNYTITLVTISDKGCRDTLSDTVSVRKRQLADFSINSLCAKAPVSLLAQVQTPYNDVSNYNWTLGNGTQQSGNPLNYTYNQSGNFQVKLVVTSALGCKDSVIKTVNIPANPIANFSIDGFQVSPGNFVKCKDELVVNFNNSSTGNQTQNWDFGLPGNGDVSTALSPSFIYPDSGYYFVNLIINQGSLCSDTASFRIRIIPPVKLNFQVADACLGNTFNFNNSSVAPLNDFQTIRWDFGQGNSSNNFSPQWVYSSPGTYNVKLITTTASGCRDTLSKAVTVFPNPVADFNDLDACVNQPRTILNQSSISTGNIPIFRWNLGNGTSSNQPNPIVTYTNPSVYTVSLIATSDKNCSDTVQDDIIVRDILNADFSQQYQVTCANVPVRFSNTSTGIYQFTEWDFGDGTKITANDTTHSYSTGGTYTIRMTAIDTLCGNASIAKTITIGEPPVIDLGDDFYLCANAEKVLTIGETAFEKVIWSTGQQNTNTISVNGTVGKIKVEIINFGCEASDSVNVINRCDIFIPSAFSPNNDGVNDIFNVIPYNVQSFILDIYNRWGEKLFSTNDINQGWNGIYKGELQPLDTYTYYLEVVNTDGEISKLKGTLQLLR